VTVCRCIAKKVLQQQQTKQLMMSIFSDRKRGMVKKFDEEGEL
jgi:hypothetical protein